MSNENTQLAVLPQAALSRQVDASQWNALKEMFDQASDQSVGLVIDYCRARKLDPMKKPVHIVPVWSNRRKCMVETVWPSISEIRTTAARTGLFAGQDETKFGPIQKQDLGNAKNFEFPEWAQVTVYRLVAGQRCAFVGPKVYFLESYATAKRDTQEPNAMWSKRTWGQLEKCAEAAALRRAFPEETGLTADEMAGKSLDDHEPINVTGTGTTAQGGDTAAPGGEEAPKRAALPKKNKGAAALAAAPASAPAAAPVATAEVEVVNEPAAPTASAPVSSEPPPAEPKKVEAVVEQQAELPAAAPVTPPPAAAPAEDPDAPVWPRTVAGCVTQCQNAPVKNNPKYTSVTVAKLGGGFTMIKGQRVQLADLGRVIFDPEKPELKPYAVVSEDILSFTIEEQPSASNPQVKNKVIIKVEAAEVEV